jgi:Cro/C1-type HTH DNA-binding domain
MPKFSSVRLRVPDLMAQAEMTAYRLAAESGGRISQRTAYRLSLGEKESLRLEELAALIDIFRLRDVGELFEVQRGKAP